MPIWSYPPLIASYLIDNSIFQIGMVVLFGVWFLGWSGTLFLSSTRMIFAAAFDRVLPDHAAQVSERRAVPIIALLYIMVPAVVVSVIYAYSSDFRALTLDATLVIAVTFLGSAIAATILPWYKPAIFDNSAVAHLKCVVSGAGLITSIILAWTIYPLAERPAVRDRGRQHELDHLPGRRLRRCGPGLRRRPGSIRRTQGVDLDAIHSEIPASRPSFPVSRRRLGRGAVSISPRPSSWSVTANSTRACRRLFLLTGGHDGDRRSPPTTTLGVGITRRAASRRRTGHIERKGWRQPFRRRLQVGDEDSHAVVVKP